MVDPEEQQRRIMEKHLGYSNEDSYSRRPPGRKDFDMLDDDMLNGEDDRHHFDRDDLGRHFLGGMPTSLDGFSNNYRANLEAFENKRIENMSKYQFQGFSSFHHSHLPMLQEAMPEKVDEEKPFILYLDSLNKVNSTNMQCLRQYIEMEYIDKKLPAEHKKYLD